MDRIYLGEQEVGSDRRPYFIAEIGSNHNGDMELCKRMVDAAAASGADCAKFQSWSDTSLIAKAEYERNITYSDKKKHFGTLREMVETYQFTPAQHRDIAAYCRDRGIAFASSVFSETEADLLDELDVPFFKIASMDINNLGLLSYVASLKRPMVISTGMADLSEIDAAIRVVNTAGNTMIALLHCVSVYPPDAKAVNLRNLPMLRSAFGAPVGFSDHTLGVGVPIAAISLGACIVEKHFTLDRELPGWDHAISAEPEEFSTLTTEGTKAFEALGSSVRTVSEAELEKRRSFRRSIVTRRSLPEGHVLREEDLTAKRPGTGIAPDDMRVVVGRVLARTVGEDELLSWADLC